MVTKTITSDRKALIIGETIQEILDYAIPLIRPQSKNFYRTEIVEDLRKQNYSWIDVHAGMKVSYDILLLPHSYLSSKFDELHKEHAHDLASLKLFLTKTIHEYQNCRASQLTKSVFIATSYQMILDKFLEP